MYSPPDSKTVVTDSEEDDHDDNDENKNSCVGTYYGELTGNEGRITYDYKYTFVLKEDNTYTADYSGISSMTGTYKIENGKIKFTHASEGNDSNITEVTDEYDIADDCSYIVYVGDKTFNLNKVVESEDK